MNLLEARRNEIANLESSIRDIRPSRVGSEPPPTLPPQRSKQLVLTLADLALRQASIGDTTEARLTIGDAILAINESSDPDSIGMASVVLGEAMLLCDIPHLAKDRFTTAIAICGVASGRAWKLRAQVGLGRALVMLDDPRGAPMLRELRPAVLGLASIVVQIDEALRGVEEAYREVKTAYGRPVSVFPPAG